MKIIKDFSPNFSKKKKKRRVNFIVIHYTGMQSEIESIKWLKNPKSKVSCHFLINRKGIVRQMVKENNVAWHAGKSKWKNINNLNKNSIGVELVNKGHQFKYQNFSKKQIKSLIKLCKILKKKYSIKKENFLGHSDIAPLRKKDPGEKFPWKQLSTFNIGKWYKKKRSHFEIDKKKKDLIFFKNLYNLGYRYFDINRRRKSDKYIIKSFQQHYSPKKVTGIIDQKTLKISQLLINL